MANTSSAKKAIRSSAKKHARNQMRKDSFRSVKKDVEKAIKSDSKNTEALVSSFYKEVDKAAKVKAISKEAAARLKSRMLSKVHKAS
jgi:small subunit ribosomal protein S20